MSQNITMRELVGGEYSDLYPYNPALCQMAKTTSESTADNYKLAVADLSVDIVAKNSTELGIIVFIPNISNNAGAKITINNGSTYPIYFSNGILITEGVLKEGEPVAVIYNNGGTDKFGFYLINSKAQAGLDNVDNTSDLEKPISTATQEELDNKINNPLSLKNNTNLNDLTKAGLYYNLITTNTYENLPEGVSGKAFQLMVMGTEEGCCQTLSVAVSTGAQVYSRTYLNETWGIWGQHAMVFHGEEKPSFPAPSGSIFIKVAAQNT